MVCGHLPVKNKTWTTLKRRQTGDSSMDGMSVEFGVICLGAAFAISVSLIVAAWFEQSKNKTDDG